MNAINNIVSIVLNIKNTSFPEHKTCNTVYYIYYYHEI